MITNWGYLLLNNLSYWLPFLPQSAETMRVKLGTRPNILNRQEWPLAYNRNGGFV